MQSTILRRTTIVVRDIDKSIAFYRDAVGLRVGWDRESVLGDAIPLAPGAKGRFATVMGEDDAIGMIGLLQVVDPPLPAPPIPDTDTLAVAATIFVIGTADCDGVYDRLKAVDARIYKAPYDQELKGRDGASIKMRSMAAWDPDGHFLEINQRF
jgi:catechol 2,3-dioxygenase-like lactoylglutathione lyase family enzyme